MTRKMPVLDLIRDENRHFASITQSRRARPDVAGPMVCPAAKQAKRRSPQADCFARNDAYGGRYCSRKSRKNDFFSPGGATGLP
jgi:hypothetical protein